MAASVGRREGTLTPERGRAPAGDTGARGKWLWAAGGWGQPPAAPAADSGGGYAALVMWMSHASPPSFMHWLLVIVSGSP